MQGFDRHAFVSLGANLPSRFGDPGATLREAIARLRGLSGGPLLISSFWKSAPVDCPPDSPAYLNAVVGLLPKPEEGPLSLLRKLQAIEQEFGRVRSGVVNEARVLDLDLISFGNEKFESTELVLPHPRASLRRFVLEPLREIVSGDWRLPGTLRSIDDSLAVIRDQEIAKIPE